MSFVSIVVDRSRERELRVLHNGLDLGQDLLLIDEDPLLIRNDSLLIPENALLVGENLFLVTHRGGARHRPSPSQEQLPASSFQLFSYQLPDARSIQRPP